MDIQAYISALKANSNECISTLDSVEESKQVLKPDSGWSLLEIAEHVFISDKVFLKMLFTESEQYLDSETKFGDERLGKILVGMRSRKVKAPEILEPRGLFKQSDDFKTAFLNQRDRLISKLEDGSFIPNNQIQPHPFLGDMTKVDWMFTIIHHTKRHIEQMKELIPSL
ncbi:DinB family protein [bacterium]|nr:MAG: DinB family protein [bacterium]